MNDAKFVYVIYIAATPDKVWQALLDGEMTRQYWQHDNVSDWKPGSKWQHRRLDGDKQPRIVGNVVKSIPPKRLVLTWALPANEADQTKHSRVTLEVEPVADMVRLTVRHRSSKRAPTCSRHQQRLAACAIEPEIVPGDGQAARCDRFEKIIRGRPGSSASIVDIGLRRIEVSAMSKLPTAG